MALATWLFEADLSRSKLIYLRLSLVPEELISTVFSIIAIIKNMGKHFRWYKPLNFKGL